ncbi:MAG TPA: hypothetical protein VGQ69_14295 [Gemmatimonadales bacterium]|nr:hypothetical protein [Gemmatimonadales bacterium]
MSRAIGVALAALITFCGNLPTTSEGVAFLQVEKPANTTIELGDSLQLHAVALDKAGDPLDVPILWRTPDTTIAVEATSGLVTTLAPGQGRVQAVVGDDELVSDFIILTVKDTAAAFRRP